MGRLPRCCPRSGEEGVAHAAAGSLVGLSRVRTTRSVADPHRSGVPRSGAADRADRRRRLRRRRDGSDPVRDRLDLERRRAVRCPRDDLAPGPLRRRAPRRLRPRATPQGHGARRSGGEVLYPSQGLFYFKVADPALMYAIFRAYNDWLAEFCRADPARLKGIAMINLDDVEDGIKELERAARLGLAGAMIAEYPAEDRRYDEPEYEPFWAAAAALDLPLSLHT